ncbi:MAG: ABC transporter substrate-binding protein [Acidobacteriota bacterium]
MLVSRSLVAPATRLALLTVAITVTLSACSDSRTASTSDEAKPLPDTIVIGTAIDFEGINEVVVRSTPLANVILYQGLFRTLAKERPDYSTGPATFEPQLAERWEFSDDRSTLTFFLRDDVQWSDGVPLTARDVRFSWEAQTHPEVNWPMAQVKEKITDVEVIDDHTVRFHFSEVYAQQLLDAVGGVILPAHAWGELPFDQWRENLSWFLDNQVVAGPYRVADWQPQQRIVLEANPNYYLADQPKTQRIVFQIVPDRDSRLNQLRAGDLDVLELSPDDVDTLGELPDVHFRKFDFRQLVFLTWNHANPLFADPAVRRALTFAIDRAEIIDVLYGEYAVLPSSPYPTYVWARDASLEPRPHDPEQAMALLAEAGWRDTDDDGILDKNGEAFAFELLTNNDNQLRMDIATMVQQQLGAIGIAVETEAIEFNTLISREFAHDFEATVMSIGIDTSLDFSWFFHTDSIDGGYNWMQYRNPEVDRVLDEIGTFTDAKAAEPLHHELQKLLYDDQPITLLYQPQRVLATDRRLSGIEPNVIWSLYHLESWHWTEAP